MEKCIFCKIVSGEIGAKRVYEDENVVAFEDINPQAPVHILVIPRRHIERVNDLKESDEKLVGHLVLVAKRIAFEKKVAESGYRLVLNCNSDAGQAVFHLHLHLLGGRRMTWPPG
ncbi:MAG: histidine triad nucleotide-binding protein [Planctomycetota bacterium]|nr:histidine triad nucleotide-binding protein [Planctomycetota bacterium]